MNNKISFNIDNGDRQVWEQSEHDGSIKLYTLVGDWTEENAISIPPGDMVMLANLYRTIKDNDIINSYINPNGSTGLTTGDNLEKALEKQIPKKPIPNEKDNIRFSLCYNCPECGRTFSGTGVANYCYHCGQALDWSDEE